MPCTQQTPSRERSPERPQPGCLQRVPRGASWGFLLFPRGRDHEGHNKPASSRCRESPRLCGLLLRGQRVHWQGCRQGGQEHCRSRAPRIWHPAGWSLPTQQHQALEPLGPSCGRSVSGCSPRGERQQRGAEPCHSKTSRQTERAGSVPSQGSAAKQGTVILAGRRQRALAEPGSLGGSQLLPWRSCGR